jgi:hypothetical protein
MDSLWSAAIHRRFPIFFFAATNSFSGRHVKQRRTTFTLPANLRNRKPARRRVKFAVA